MLLMKDLHLFLEEKWIHAPQHNLIYVPILQISFILILFIPIW